MYICGDDVMRVYKMCHEGRKLFLTISQWSVGTMSRESKYIISPPCTLIKWKSRMYYGIKK